MYFPSALLEHYSWAELVKLGVLLAATAAIVLILQSKSSAKPKPSFYGDKKGRYKPPKIRPVDPSFRWEDSTYYKSYPFKNGEYKLTMGIKRVDAQDWLLMEPSYKKSLETKKLIVTNSHPAYPPDKDLYGSTIFVTPEVVPVVEEFYNTVIRYMCDKYPMYFVHEGTTVLNKVTGERVPSKYDGDVKAADYLVHLTKVIEEDFIFLMPDKQIHESEYVFKGGVFAFAAGFNPNIKFNKPLTAIHAPIPGYEEKMKLSMNRFFSRLEKGQFVLRNNFSAQVHPLYYVDDQNKGHNDTYLQRHFKEEDLDFENDVHYRSERQVLTRLPRTGAIVFTIRTYLHPMSEFRKEGKEVCERFIGAINGLPPDIFTYKAAGEWSDAVKSYLAKYDDAK